MPVADATSARVAAVMAFHSVSTFSSRAGWTRCARAAARRARASSTSGGRSSGAPTGRTGMERPSQLPRSVIPYHSAAGPTSAAGRIWRNSSRVKVACAPSTPPASASKDE